jgi:riboflavin transporter FmnP
MDSFDLTRALVFVLFIGGLLVYVIGQLVARKSVINTKFIVKTAIFSAMSVILYTVPYLKFSVPFFPSFLEIHLDEIPALIAGFAYGPLCGFFVILIKTIIKLPMTTTMCVGELADFIYSSIFIIPAAIIYRKNRKIKGALLGLLIGGGLQLVTASFITTFLMLDFYIMMMGFPKEAILKMCQAINPMVTSLDWPFLLMVALPFNLFKDILVVVVTFILYKNMHRFIDKKIK